ncbi:type VI secretion system TssO [Chitinophagaceae bacterium MMS25-I14]
MKPLNSAQIRRQTLLFRIYFIIFILFAFVPVYAFVKSYDVQKRAVISDIDDYKTLLNKQQQLHQKIDTLYNRMSLLNTGKVENDQLLERYIADSKDDIIRLVGNDSSDAFMHYASLMKNIDNMLHLKDTIIQIRNRERAAYIDLTECMNNTRKIKQDLSTDPSRKFTAQ